MEDFAIREEHLESYQYGTIKSYSTLNHLFLKGNEHSYPDDYNLPGNIHEYLIKDIVSWINEREK